VLAGDGLSLTGRRRVDAAVATATRVSGLDFDAFVGAAGDSPREHALALHSRLSSPDRSVLVLCDPAARALEIVTGESIRQFLDDTACRLAVATMTSSFLAGDLVGGLVRGIQQLGEAAHHPTTLHA
jgi:uncharacterized membrane protein YgcG